MSKETFITLAIHSYDKALVLRDSLENNGIVVKLQNVNLKSPTISLGVRVRIPENSLPLALRIVENDNNIENHIDDNIHNNKLLIPIDFTENSITACKVGFEYAKKFSLHPVILNSFETPYFKGSLPISDNFSADIKDAEIRSNLEAQANTQMRLMSERINKMIDNSELPNIKYSTIIKEGVPEEVILDYSKMCNPSLILMATRGQSKKKQELIGSVTAEVLDSCRVPVFTIPEECEIGNISEINRIAFICNLDHNDIISFDLFIRLFKDKNLDIDVIPVNEKAGAKIYERVKRLVTYFETHYDNHKFHSVILSHRSFRNDIESLIKNHNIKLLVVPNKKKSIYARLFNPSIAHKMLFERDIPMLVLPI